MEFLQHLVRNVFLIYQNRLLNRFVGKKLLVNAKVFSHEKMNLTLIFVIRKTNPIWPIVSHVHLMVWLI